jgi:hypothetical protein
MSSVTGPRESIVASTKLNDLPPENLQKYSFRWIKWTVDKLFPARTLNFEGDRSTALPTRR